MCISTNGPEPPEGVDMQWRVRPVLPDKVSFSAALSYEIARER